MTFRLPGRTKVAAPATGERAEVELVPMRRRHVRQVAAIEERIFPRPWSPALYYSELAMPSTRIYVVALAGDTVVGYAGCMLVVGEGHITTIGVSPEWQRKRIGMRLLHHLASEARERGATSLTLEVRVSNHGAQELYRTFGFVPAGIRKNYYAEVNEDGLVMWAHGVDSEDYGMRLEEIENRLQGDPGGER
jgi:ribosomal-protein-alanine N-acetyltransferase